MKSIEHGIFQGPLLPFLLLLLLLTNCGRQGVKPAPTPTPTDTGHCLQAEQKLK